MVDYELITHYPLEQQHTFSRNALLNREVTEDVLGGGEAHIMT